MTLQEFLKEKGLRPAHVAQKIGVSRQAIEKYGRGHNPFVSTMEKVAAAMTELGVPTKAIDIIRALHPETEELDDENRGESA